MQDIRRRRLSVSLRALVPLQPELSGSAPAWLCQTRYMFRLLFSQAIEGARKAGYSHLYIESFPQFSDAVAMYERHGFRHIPQRLGDSGHTATTIFMVKEL